MGEKRQRMTRKQFAWLTEYLTCWNATEAARRVGYKSPQGSGYENLHHPAVVEAVKRWASARAMGADEVLVRLAEQARADIGQFFKVVERWLRSPLPTHEVLDERVVVDDADKGTTHVEYLARQVVLDVDKLTNPQFSHLVHKFTDSPRNGLGLELYDGQHALELVGKHHRLFVEAVEHTGKDGGPIEMKDSGGPTDEQRLASLMALYERVRAHAVSQPAGAGSAVDPAPGPTDGGVPLPG